MATTLEQARAAKSAAKEALSGIAEVAGIGVAMVGDDYVLKVNLRAPPPAGVKIPTKIAGVRVIVEVVGRIRKRR